MNKNVHAHRGFGERFRLGQEHLVGLSARGERLAPDDHHQRHGHRGDAACFDVEHGCGRSVDEADEAAELRHPPPRIVPRCAEKQVLRFVATQHVVDEVS